MSNKVIGWLVVAFLVYFASTNPSGFAGLLKSAWGGVGNVADGLGRALTAVFA